MILETKCSAAIKEIVEKDKIIQQNYDLLERKDWEMKSLKNMNDTIQND